jgi:hypothetical protein
VEIVGTEGVLCSRHNTNKDKEEFHVLEELSILRTGKAGRNSLTIIVEEYCKTKLMSS